jgi:hypothetical protein
MATVTVSQLPGALDLVFVAGDELNVAITLGQNITGYSLTTGIYPSGTSVFSGGAAVSTVYSRSGSDVTTFTTTVAAASTGTISIGLSETQTALLTPGQPYRWYLTWVASPGSVTRTVLSGNVTVTAP